MRILTAQLPPAGDSADRVFSTDTAVIVLDGASAYLPVPVPAQVYAQRLGQELRDRLRRDPRDDLRDTLSAAIQATAMRLHLRPGRAPSSTVTIARVRAGRLELLLLGDNVVVLPDQVLSDDRMDRFGDTFRAAYRRRLVAGAGYDHGHRALLQQLQARQAEYRNRPGGYWIAEADPAAADHALTIDRPMDAAPWVILATDGAYHTMTHLGLTDWAALAHGSQPDLAAILQRCQTWEGQTDPTGRHLPRAKCHDDKTLAAIDLGT